MTDTDDPGRDRREQASSDTLDGDAAPGETPADPAYASGAGFSGEASGAASEVDEARAEAGPDPLGAGQPDPTRPDIGAGTTGSGTDEPSAAVGADALGAAAGRPESTSTPRPESADPASGAAAGASAAGGVLADADAKTMAFVAHAANIATIVVPPLGTIAALVVAYLKKDTAPDWIRTHFVLAIRTGFIAAIAAVALLVLSVLAVPLLFVGIGFVLFPLIGVGWLLLGAWIVVRSVVAMIKLNENKPYPDPETWLI